MTDELLKKLLESGVHFGHQTRRWNPKMKKFIFGQRSGIYIIDLEKTIDRLNTARDFVHELSAKGGRVLFVGTKKQAQMVVQEAAQQTEMFYVNNRWMGGLLTNFHTVKKSVERMKSIEKMKENGIFSRLSKKEIAMYNKERDKLARDLEGIRAMGQLPDAVFIIDTKREEIAVREANKLGIPIIGLLDTNCDPDVVDFPIPANDDALKSIRLITSLISETITTGRKEFATNKKVQEKASTPTTEKNSAPPVTPPVKESQPVAPQQEGGE